MSERASTLSSPASRGSRSRRGTLLRQDASQSFGSTAWKPDGSTEQAPAPVQQAPFPSSATMNNLDLSYDYHHANNLSEHSPGFDSDAWMFHQQSIYPMSSAQSSGRISQNHTVDPSSLSASRDRRSVTESQNEHPGHDDAADDDYGSGTTRQANVEQSNALSAQGLAERGNLYAYMMAQDQVASSKANIPAGLYSHLSPHHQIQRPLDTFTMSLNQYPQQRSPTSRSSHMTSAQGRDPASLTYENGTMIRSDEVVDRSHRLRPSLSRISGKGHNVDSPMPSHSPISGNPTELDTASNLVGDTQEATGPPKRKYSGSDNTPRIKRRYSPTSRSSVALRRKLGSCATCRKRKVKVGRTFPTQQPLLTHSEVPSSTWVEPRLYTSFPKANIGTSCYGPRSPSRHSYTLAGACKIGRISTSSSTILSRAFLHAENCPFQ